ncbi:hypothetical protein A2U01_0107170, partial [Trifolium medium]|nr:hypothetical protein [Trifolium medium]
FWCTRLARDKARLARIVLRVLRGGLNASLAREWLAKRGRLALSRHASLCVTLTLKPSGLPR